MKIQGKKFLKYPTLGNSENVVFEKFVGFRELQNNFPATKP
jgi:hypothetical protein